MYRAIDCTHPGYLLPLEPLYQTIVSIAFRYELSTSNTKSKKRNGIQREKYEDEDFDVAKQDYYTTVITCLVYYIGKLRKLAQLN